jgi:pimeloyl-ACP methyl ester carboxylesterase
MDARMLVLLVLASITAFNARAEPPRPVAAYGAELEGFEYPHPVQRFAFTSQGLGLSMAYMDVAPGRPNGRTVILLHGKNFCGATWEATIARLRDSGYRVIVPDQIGFCKSTKPAHYQYSFHQLAENTHALLVARGIERATIVGHSMGGMLAIRYALMYPDQVERLVVVNPLGLEDWKAEGVPYRTVDAAYRGELATTFDSIKKYQLDNYYAGQWKPDYDRWVLMQAGLYAGDGRQRVAWNQALTSDMVYTQPVVHELPRLRVPTVLLIGGRDRTAPGKALASPEVARRLGDYERLGRRAAEAIPHARLVAFPDLGHAPQMEAPDRFHAALLDELARPTGQ